MSITLAPIDECEEIQASTPTTLIESLLAWQTKLNIDAAEFIPSQASLIPKMNKEPKPYPKKERFVPKYKPRAYLNIYIGKHITKELLNMINEDFEKETSKLYNYLDGTIAIQLIMKQMYIFQKSENEKLSIINLDLHQQRTNKPLYGIVVPNDAEKIQKCNQGTSDKWLWKLVECLSADEIQSKYSIDDLPKSSRVSSKGLYKQIQQQRNEFNVSKGVLLNMRWTNMKNIQQIGASARRKKRCKDNVCYLKQHYWQQCVGNSWNQFDVIPLVVYDVSRYWIEFVKFIYIECMRSYIGVSFRYNSDGYWNVQSIYLDKGDIYNKYRLCGLRQSDDSSFDFNTAITKIKWV